MKLIHEDLDCQPAHHGSARIGKEGFKKYIVNWQDSMEQVVYTPTNFLPGGFSGNTFARRKR